METEKNNILIANFMSLEIGHGNMVLSKTNWTAIKYHSSWDWLIPVLNQIRDMISDEVIVKDFDELCILEESLNPYHYDINTIHKAVVEFIKWYNNNNK